MEHLDSIVFTAVFMFSFAAAVYFDARKTPTHERCRAEPEAET